MSAYICNNKTISCLAEAFFDYGVEFRDGKYHPVEIIVDRKKKIREIGQALLEQNYKSVDFRYQETSEVPEFEYENVMFNEGDVAGCIACYEYQACETSDYYESEIHDSLQRLKDKLLICLLRRNNMKMPYGFGGQDMLED